MSAPPLTPEEQAASLARAEAATPGPWSADSPHGGPGGGPIWSDGGERICFDPMREEDARFLSAAREDIPRWGATVAAKNAEIADLKAEREAVRAGRMAVLQTSVFAPSIPVVVQAEAPDDLRQLLADGEALRALLTEGVAVLCEPQLPLVRTGYTPGAGWLGGMYPPSFFAERHLAIAAWLRKAAAAAGVTMTEER